MADVQLDTTYTALVSLLPYDLTEPKPGLNPNEFNIARAPKGGFSITVIPNNVYYLVNTDPLSDPKEVRQIRVPVPSIEVAQSIINDYVSAMLGVEPPDAVPGLFAVAGNWKDKAAFAIKHAKELQHYRECQNRWFSALARMADDSWAHNKMPSTISDLQRDAARALELKRDWLDAAPNEEIIKCPMCKNAINEGAVKCIACGFILNKAEHDKLLASVK